jgi:hypothetical protein
MIPIPRVAEREHRRARRVQRMKLGAVRRRYEVTFEECRGILRLFISGLSIENIVRLTGLRESRIVEVLFVTRELLLRDRKMGIGSLVPR